MFRLFRNLSMAVAMMISACATTEVSTTPAETVQPLPKFELANDPWVALHHYAYHQARALSDMKVKGRVPMLDADIAAFTLDVAKAFEPVSAAYEPHLGSSLLFTGSLRWIAVALSHGDLEGVPDEAVKQALKDFMPVYQEHFWPRHQADSARFIRSVEDDLTAYGDAMASRLADHLDGEWGTDPLRVDIVPYANWAGAYTGTRPFGHITMSANDPEINQHKFEMLFHEASHTSPLGDQLEAAADAAIAKTGLEFPRYWHALLWYASGTAARETLGKDYEPYYVTSGRLTNEPSATVYQAFEAVWGQHDTLDARAMAAADLAMGRVD
ncbi:hypothetical protein GCM10007853_12150 [Algimonas ampicilliniresistens]|uniref:DUF4932 domain-containing protein n=1 Tax=Algimonas ampicilliniresistens TaxID=1298735 RepID=A0ABQ5V720_9PROT|nr:hypothetical protein [Algimonas ampicilliniresistens]GLQ23341.1 hypothetical protein GCM10007853_12150 [Algimonas ampicilliniresistens]